MPAGPRVRGAEGGRSHSLLWERFLFILTNMASWLSMVLASPFHKRSWMGKGQRTGMGQWWLQDCIVVHQRHWDGKTSHPRHQQKIRRLNRKDAAEILPAATLALLEMSPRAPPLPHPDCQTFFSKMQCRSHVLGKSETKASHKIDRTLGSRLQSTPFQQAREGRMFISPGQTSFTTDFHVWQTEDQNLAE